MIEFSHVYKTFEGQVHALKDVSFKVGKGEFVYLIGPSGAGKTTLFNLISAYDQATSGSLNVLGYNLDSITDKEVPYLRRRMGVVYQDFKLLEDRTVYENICLPLEVIGEKLAFVRKRVNEVIDRVGLTGKNHSFPAQLSGGEKQRAAIARALVHHPGVLVADEPTGNLDPSLSRDIIDLLHIVNSQGTTVFCATHDYDLIEYRPQRTLKIDGGKMTEVIGA